MAEDTVKPEMGEQVETQEQPKEPKAEIAEAPKDAETQAELEKVRKALKDANKEAAARRLRLEELEKAEEDRKLAQMSEQEKLQAQLKALENERAQLLKDKQDFEHRELQRKVAVDTGLPAALATRIVGGTEEEMVADAKSILELLPKQEAEKKPAAPKLEPTNPGDAKKGETRAQQKERLLGARVNPWTPTGASERGGGVVIAEKD